jgi:rhodanese-related sulfurtransferase
MQDLHRTRVQDLVEKGAQVVEVLPAEEFQAEHLPSAINLPLPKIETEARRQLDPRLPVIVYCWDSA